MNANPRAAALPLRIFANPNARDGAADRLRDSAGRLLGGQADVIETTSPEETRRAIERACEEGYAVVAAGGDGTVHAVVNALLATPSPTPLGILPLGTSNNFCRDLGLPLDVDEALAVFRGAVATPVDLVRLTADGEQRYGATIATAGNADRVIEGLGDDDKQTWGAWCYLRAALPVMTDLASYPVEIAFDGGPATSMALWNLIIANGRYAGGGLDVAPRARLDDGLLDAVLIAEGEGLDLASLATDFLLNDYLEHERVTFRQASQIDIVSPDELRFLTDGEAISGRRFRFEAAPQALSVLLPPV
ncbi:Lipid kinase YegS [Botrimarina colliarenosi]|uniref:Lipid kinase YegS n=1 Tax=Botrimarina colliarenosi TaxID=2528001 RepID=A0A5C6AJB2_9BACT|nr:diacylglycerol kinase family protein [Botrimarina colliarenosi]TWT99151.1 Lipid kinase YegS [Botrimarina colliarenosi]